MKKIINLILFIFLLNTVSYAGFFDKIQKTIKKNKKTINTVKKVYKAINISEEDEINMGQNLAKRLIATYGLYNNDKMLYKYINLIGNALASISERPNLKWYFNILNSDDVNAFACPGGFIFITKGALKFAKNEDEIAGVLAHEISHVTLKHEMKELKKSTLLNVGVEQINFKKNKKLMNKITDFLFNRLLKNGRSRKDEYQADAHSLIYLNKRGYNSELYNYLNRLKSNTNKYKVLLATHPPIPSRVIKLKLNTNWKGSNLKYRAARFKFFLSDFK